MRKERIQKEITGWIPYILLIAGIYLLFHVVLFGGLVPSSSMAPTLSNRCITLGMRFGYSLNRYDIVDFGRASKETKVTYVKRIIGLPGETIEIRSGTTYIDGEELDEPYLAEKPDDFNFGPYVIPDNSFFMMGDNRNHSNDSRYWAEHAVPRGNIEAKLFFRFNI